MRISKRISLSKIFMEVNLEHLCVYLNLKTNQTALKGPTGQTTSSRQFET
jgi:hypothetical protein